MAVSRFFLALFDSNFGAVAKKSDNPVEDLASRNSQLALETKMAELINDQPPLPKKCRTDSEEYCCICRDWTLARAQVK